MIDLDKIRQRAKIKVERKLKAQDIHCVYSTDYFEFSNEERTYIENEWNKAIKLKPFLFNGKLIHVKKQTFYESNIMFSMCNSFFKEFIVTATTEFKKIFGKSKVIMPISVGTMIVTSDDKWIIGRRAKTHDYEGSYTLVSGYMDADKDIVRSKPDPFFAIKRELTEETGVGNEDIDDIFCLGLDGETQPYLAFLTRLTISSDQFNCRIPKEKEFTKFEYHDLRREEIKNFLLTNYKQITPHALANILMFYSV